MEVLIVSKTHMGTMSCVGGLILSSHRFIRLLNQDNFNQPGDTNYDVGDIWNLSFINRTPVHPPHIEDVIVTAKTYLRTIENISAYLHEKNLVDWNGHVNNLFDGLLHWTNSGTGYIPVNGQLPNQSVGFWVSDRDLIRVEFEQKVRFRYPNGNNYRNISYVGYQETIENIPAGTILRVSFSRIFPPQNSPIQAPQGYYLQLSGWYEIDKRYIEDDFEYREPSDDLPF
jgi:hypothetical protein